MIDRAIDNPIPNAPFVVPSRYWRFDDDGITNESVQGRRKSECDLVLGDPPGRQLEHLPTFGPCLAPGAGISAAATAAAGLVHDDLVRVGDLRQRSRGAPAAHRACVPSCAAATSVPIWPARRSTAASRSSASSPSPALPAPRTALAASHFPPGVRPARGAKP